NVVLEWVGKKPEEQVVSKVTAILSKDFNIVVSSSRIKGAGGSVGIDGQKAKSSISEFSGEKREGFGSALSNSMPDKSVSLFDGIESIETSHRDDLQQKNDRLTEIPSMSPSSPSINKENLAAKGINTGRFSLADESALWDEADARVVGGTLRSGQKIESDHSLVVLGDVNSGAEVVAGGDIVVLGKLRGVAHAGAYDETGGGRFIFALELQPTQLRIGTVISRGSSDGSRSAEIAKVDGNLIVVEPYNARSAVRRNII
ncbi:MAG: septum site-determining protein MinC, partial [Bdellovibrionales bacterium]|nr:septum site-determining protein MinC [Bdellovibrionales bacterium]